MFPFLSKEKRSGIGKRTLSAINQAVHQFLQARDVQNFKVYTIEYDNTPVVLIQALPQKKLRFSNILEIQIRRHVREKLNIQVPAVFWRFKTDYTEEPGPEQADYEFDEQPEYPQDKEAQPTEATETDAKTPAVPSEGGQEKKAASESQESNEHYDVRHLARKGMQVEEISMGEFDEFLKGSGEESPPPKE